MTKNCIVFIAFLFVGTLLGIISAVYIIYVTIHQKYTGFEA